MKDNLISVIIPVYNESKNIEFVASELSGLFNKKGLDYEILFVDDGSADDSLLLLNRLSSGNSRLITIENGRNYGKGYSIIQGLNKIKGSFFIIMDGDGQIDINDISTIVDKMTAGSMDFVIGSKYQAASYNKSDLFRKEIGFTYNFLVRALLGYKLTDIQAGIKGGKSDSFRKLLPIKAAKFDFDLEFIAKAIEYGMEIEEIPIKVRERHSGKSKVNKIVTSFGLLKQILQIFLRKHFGNKPIHGNYQYKALYSGNAMQRFWHSNKLELVKKLNIINDGDSLLDAGCGSGNFSFEFAKKCRVVYGIDLGRENIDFVNKLKEKNSISNAVFIQAPVDKIPVNDGFFDVAIMIDVIEHLTDVNASMKELSRVLKKSGSLIIVTPNYKSYWSVLEKTMDMLNLAPKFEKFQHINKYDKKSLTGLLTNSGFSITRIGTIYKFSPFISFLSMKLAAKMFENEFIRNTNNGGLIFCTVVKQ